MRKCRCFLILMSLLSCSFLLAQVKNEREFRIKKSQFPEKAQLFIQKELTTAKKIRFYKEIDGAKKSYEAKFKKDRLFYSIEFDENGLLEDIEIIIKKIDIPEDSYFAITSYLDKEFKKYKIRKIQQQYSVKAFGAEKNTMKMAFQNLLDPKINYELIISGKKEKEFLDFEIQFAADGSFIQLRKSLPANYDHVLY